MLKKGFAVQGIIIIGILIVLLIWFFQSQPFAITLKGNTNIDTTAIKSCGGNDICRDFDDTEIFIDGDKIVESIQVRNPETGQTSVLGFGTNGYCNPTPQEVLDALNLNPGINDIEMDQCGPFIILDDGRVYDASNNLASNEQLRIYSIDGKITERKAIVYWNNLGIVQTGSGPVTSLYSQAKAEIPFIVLPRFEDAVCITSQDCTDIACPQGIAECTSYKCIDNVCEIDRVDPTTTTTTTESTTTSIGGTTTSTTGTTTTTTQDDGGGTIEDKNVFEKIWDWFRNLFKRVSFFQIA